MAVNFKHYDTMEIKNMAQKVKISGHTNITNPEKCGYPYLESIRSFANLCDEVIVVDGGSTDGSLEKIKEIPNVRIVQGEKWKKNFDWTIIGRNTNIGFKECKNKWAFHFDCDYIFHEDDVATLKEEIVKTDLPAIEIRKVNFVLCNENFTKAHFPLLVNKGTYKAVCYGIGTDYKGNESATFLRPISRNYTNKDGMEVGETIKMSTCRVYRSNVPIYTYDFTLMHMNQIAENRSRFQSSLHRFLGKDDEVNKERGFKLFIGMMKQRHQKCQKEGRVNMKLEEHSKFIRDKIANITPEQFGFNGFKEL